jgi:hypothetical protein
LELEGQGNMGLEKTAQRGASRFLYSPLVSHQILAGDQINKFEKCEARRT